MERWKCLQNEILVGRHDAKVRHVFLDTFLSRFSSSRINYTHHCVICNPGFHSHIRVHLMLQRIHSFSQEQTIISRLEFMSRHTYLLIKLSLSPPISCQVYWSNSLSPPVFCQVSCSATYTHFTLFHVILLVQMELGPFCHPATNKCLSIQFHWKNWHQMKIVLVAPFNFKNRVGRHTLVLTMCFRCKLRHLIPLCGEESRSAEQRFRFVFCPTFQITLNFVFSRKELCMNLWFHQVKCDLIRGLWAITQV